MKTTTSWLGTALIGLSALALAACETLPYTSPENATLTTKSEATTFDVDRSSILAMAGNYDVTFDFTETISFVEGYELKEPKVSGGHEVVRVIEDTGEFISLQHILVVGPSDAPIIVKHWRQDWQYEPERVLMFIGGNAWGWRDVPQAERAGTWSQTVYQVDDSPRYGAVARWSYEGEIAEWQPDQEWRPLPRRDMTTRDDYHAVDAVNRHVITPWGWVHEQDNSKLILSETPRVLAREVGLNTYRQFDDFPVQAAEDYWAATADYWAGIRSEWARIADENERFAITIKGETGDLYGPLMELAEAVQSGDKKLELALEEARQVMAAFTTNEIGQLADRLRPTTTLADASY